MWDGSAWVEDDDERPPVSLPPSAGKPPSGPEGGAEGQAPTRVLPFKDGVRPVSEAEYQEAQALQGDPLRKGIALAAEFGLGSMLGAPVQSVLKMAPRALVPVGKALELASKIPTMRGGARILGKAMQRVGQAAIPATEAAPAAVEAAPAIARVAAPASQAPAAATTAAQAMAPAAAETVAAPAASQAPGAELAALLKQVPGEVVKRPPSKMNAAIRAARESVAAKAAPSVGKASEQEIGQAFMRVGKEAASKNPSIGEKIWVLLDDAGMPVKTLTPNEAAAAARAGKETTWIKNLWSN